jgi:glycosyltransferase involved in cell wall biosynthesis
MRKTFIKYIPHGINPATYFKYTEQADLDRVASVKKAMFGEDVVDFVVMYNNRNIRRKMTGDVIMAFREFAMQLTPEEQNRVRLLMHTQPVDDNGTDLLRLIADVAPEIKVVFSSERVDFKTMNDIYNVSDVVINIASNEGFGLGTLEAMMAERMIIANVTGGLQDQMGFRDEVGNLLHEDVHYNDKWGSNHDGKYKTHGEWVEAVFPSNRALIGSVPTPYIFDDRCSFYDAAAAIMKVYKYGPEERNRRGKLGREYALSNGFSADAMCQGFIDGIETTLANWKPRKRFEMIKL